MSRWKKISIQLGHKAEEEPVPIVSDAAVATRDLADGRIIPLLILDTSQRPDIEEMIHAHKFFGSGDVKSIWSIPSKFDTSKIYLILTITKPSQCVIIIEFEVVPQVGVVDQIIHAQGVYLQPGRKGDRYSSTMERERILVEIPSKEFRKEWSRILRKALIKDYQRKGLSKKDAKLATEDFIREWRKFGSQRLWSH